MKLSARRSTAIRAYRGLVPVIILLLLFSVFIFNEINSKPKRDQAFFKKKFIIHHEEIYKTFPSYSTIQKNRLSLLLINLSITHFRNFSLLGIKYLFKSLMHNPFGILDYLKKKKL